MRRWWKGPRRSIVAWLEAEWCPILMDIRGRILELRMDWTGRGSNAADAAAAAAAAAAVGPDEPDGRDAWGT